MIKLTSHIILFLGFFCTTILAQKEDYNWIFNFSSNAEPDSSSVWGASILDFNTLPPNFYREFAITFDFDKTNAITSDINGNIIMYSNGQSIFGGNHHAIFNGDTINYSPKWDWLTVPNPDGINTPGGFRINQLITFVPVPEKSKEWLCLYQNYEDVGEGRDYYQLWMSRIEKIEMELSVTVKDSVINTTIFQRGMVTTCQHANGRDWWLLQNSRDSLYAYLIDPHGIALDHVQVLPIIVPRLFGQSKFSKNGSKFCFYGKVNENAALFLADFDRCTGQFNNITFKEFEPENAQVTNNGVEFSEDGKFLYVAELERILQYDLDAEEIFESAVEVGRWDEFLCDFGSNGLGARFGVMQRGPDDRIYISGSQQCFYLHRIDYSNEKGEECGFKQRAIRLPTYHVGTVPNFNTLRLGPLDGSPCDTLGIDNHPFSRFWYEQDSADHHTVQLWDVSYFRPESWEWNFGDGSGSEERHPIHEYDSNGNYEVCLTVSNENSTHTSCQDIQIGPVSTDDPSREYDISIYPNPVEDFTRLVFHDYLPEEARIVLYDISGRKVFSTKVYQECMIDLSGLGEGAYFYEVMDVNVSLVSGKLVKM